MLFQSCEPNPIRAIKILFPSHRNSNLNSLQFINNLIYAKSFFWIFFCHLSYQLMHLSILNLCEIFVSSIQKLFMLSRIDIWPHTKCCEQHDSQCEYIALSVIHGYRFVLWQPIFLSFVSKA
jgi:hypothetical protein